LAWSCVQVDDIDGAFQWLEKAVDDRDTDIRVFIRESITEDLESHPKYRALLRRAGLES
jgi:hypothetical protein